jgi:hypothetical protein
LTPNGAIVVSAADPEDKPWTQRIHEFLLPRLEQCLGWLEGWRNGVLSPLVIVLSFLFFGTGLVRYLIFSSESNFEPDYSWTTIIIFISLLQVFFATFVRARTLLRVICSGVLLSSFLAACLSWVIYTLDRFWPALKYFPLAAATLCVLVSVGMTYVMVSRTLGTKLQTLRHEIRGNLFPTLMFFVALFFNITILLSFALAFDDQPLHRALSGHGASVESSEPAPDLRKFDVSLYSMSVFDPAEVKNVLLGQPVAPGDKPADRTRTAEAVGWRFLFKNDAIDLGGKAVVCDRLHHFKVDERSNYWNQCELAELREAVASCRSGSNSSVVTIWTPAAAGAAARAIVLQGTLKAEFPRNCNSPRCNPNDILIHTLPSSTVLGGSQRWKKAFPVERSEDILTDSSFAVLDLTHECSAATPIEAYALRLSRSRRLQLLDYIYFTTYTITTTGYGDIVPISGFAKFICSIANFFELFFVVIFFNCLVAAASEKKE